jgi:hypothetical protein
MPDFQGLAPRRLTAATTRLDRLRRHFPADGTEDFAGEHAVAPVEEAALD